MALQSPISIILDNLKPLQNSYFQQKPKIKIYITKTVAKISDSKQKPNDKTIIRLLKHWLFSVFFLHQLNQCQRSIVAFAETAL